MQARHIKNEEIFLENDVCVWFLVTTTLCSKIENSNGKKKKLHHERE